MRRITRLRAGRASLPAHRAEDLAYRRSSRSRDGGQRVARREPTGPRDPRLPGRVRSPGRILRCRPRRAGVVAPIEVTIWRLGAAAGAGAGERRGPNVGPLPEVAAVTTGTLIDESGDRQRRDRELVCRLGSFEPVRIARSAAAWSRASLPKAPRTPPRSGPRRRSPAPLAGARRLRPGPSTLTRPGSATLWPWSRGSRSSGARPQGRSSQVSRPWELEAESPRASARAALRPRATG